MNAYSIFLFLHVVGALGFFTVLVLEWIGLAQIKSATQTESVRLWMRIFKSTDRLGFISMPTTIGTGLYMMLTVWGRADWLLVVLGALVLEIVLFLWLTVPRMAAIRQTLSTETETVSITFHALVNEPLLWISAQIRVAIVLGIIFLKIAKPDLSWSLLTIGVAILLGLAAALPGLENKRSQKGSPRRRTALFVIVIVAGLALLGANAISAGAIPLIETTSDVQGVQATPTRLETDIAPSNSYTLVPTPLSTPVLTLSPETAGQDGPSILRARCTECHSLEPIERTKRTRVEWEQVLSKMERLNAKISDKEKSILLDYLTSVDKP